MVSEFKEICCGAYLKCSVCGHEVYSPHYYEDGSRKTLQRKHIHSRRHD